MFRSLRKSLSICAMLALACAGAQAQDRLANGSWDLSADFSATKNPNGAWSYGWTESDGSRFTRGTRFQPAAGVDAWAGFRADDGTGTPFVSHNGTGTTIWYGTSLTLFWEPGEAIFHPGPGNERAVVRWTAPSGGEFAVQSRLYSKDWGATDVSVVLNGTRVYAANLDYNWSESHYEDRLVLAAGDTVDFTVGYGTDGNYSTFSGNSAGRDGGIANSATLTVTNTVVANSGGGNCNAVTDGGHNLQWPGTDCGVTIRSSDPKLDPDGLKGNGGPTQTIALLPGSPAIDAGDPEVCANPPMNGFDQRGYVRPGTGSVNCSIGAYEYNSPGPPTGCIGDCNANARVTVDEIITLVNIALGTGSMAECGSGDADLNNAITIDEILTAVSNALNGCPVPPTPTPTPTKTPTPSPTPSVPEMSTGAA